MANTVNTITTPNTATVNMSDFSNSLPCKYRLPCGWCDRRNCQCTRTSLWDRATTNPCITSNDSITLFNVPTCTDAASVPTTSTSGISSSSISSHRKPCNHHWECTGVDTLGANYECSLCHELRRDYFTHED